MNDYSNYDVVFVGGGPVGLWTAVQAKLHDPRLNVVVLEKEASYQRIHSLYINAASLKTSCKSVDLDAIIKVFKATSPLSTQVIESSLIELAEKIGVVVAKNFRITDPDNDLKPFTHAKVIVGSDGRYSTLRTKVTGYSSEEQSLINSKSLQYIADLTYDEVALPLNKFRKILVNSTAGNAMHEIHSKKRKQTTLRTFISAIDFHRLKNAKRKSPEPFYSPLIPQDLRDEFLAFLGEKYDDVAEIDLAKASITTTQLTTYMSTKFVKVEKERIYCLVGDAAFGVPYFRSLNNGFVWGTELAKVIVHNLKNEKAFIKYEQRAMRAAQIEIGLASTKTFFIELWIGMVKRVSRALRLSQEWSAYET